MKKQEENHFKERIKKLKEENEELKEIVAIALNKKLLKQLANEIKRIEEGNFIDEKHFLKKHRLIAS